MDKTKNKNVIAIAINPKFARAILQGRKAIEFRRNGVPTEISHIVLYSTKPDQEIIGYCEVRECVVAPTKILWRSYGKFGLISREHFFSYYKGHKVGKCYIINKSWKFIRPLPLSQCRSFDRAPQSFSYIRQSEWKNLKRKKKVIAKNFLYAELRDQHIQLRCVLRRWQPESF
jgi:predicted transcriptional regulator